MKCSYCAKEIPKGHGTMFVHKTGKLSYYCSSKCYKNDIVVKRKLSYITRGRN